MGTFTKSNLFSYQSEWRITTPPTGRKTNALAIGSIKDISLLARSEQVDESLRIEVKDQ